MPAGVSRPLPALMLVMLSFSASRLAKRLSGAGVKICVVDRQLQSNKAYALIMGSFICPYACAAECLAHS